MQYIQRTKFTTFLENKFAATVTFHFLKRNASDKQILPMRLLRLIGMLFVSSQVFEIYDALPDPSPTVMNAVVRGAVNLCSGCYICVGIFGYITFSAVDVGGNILTEFPPTLFVEIIKLGFVLSVAVSFPLVVFPCRTAIHSLMFRKGAAHTDMVTNYIPPDRFNAITIVVILITLSLGIMIPDIELVLGLVGSTIGSAICVIFPALIFTKIMSKNTTERLAAQFIFFIGIAIMVCGTYVNLNEANKVTSSVALEVNPDQDMSIRNGQIRIPQPIGPISGT